MTSDDPRKELARIRQSIDNIDAAVIHMLAERFARTKRVGHLKAEHNLPPSDPNREQQQIAREVGDQKATQQKPGDRHHQFLPNRSRKATNQPADAGNLLSESHGDRECFDETAHGRLLCRCHQAIARSTNCACRVDVNIETGSGRL